MKNLLYKELKLTANLQTYIYCFLSMTIMIPSYPSLVSFFYPLVGLTIIFSISTANRDLLYTSILPIRKRDVVKAKVLLIMYMEIITMLISIPFGFLRILLTQLMEEQTFVDLGFNIAFYGFGFLIFSLFNIIYLPWYYKKPDGKNIWPFIVADVSAGILLLLIMTVFMLFPSWTAYVNSYELPNLLVQFAILLGGALIFLLSSFLSYILGAKSFQKVNI